jgi:hypothetical protein
VRLHADLTVLSQLSSALNLVYPQTIVCDRLTNAVGPEEMRLSIGRQLGVEFRMPTPQTAWMRL